jgi:hypothetical protein
MKFYVIYGGNPLLQIGYYQHLWRPFSSQKTHLSLRWMYIPQPGWRPLNILGWRGSRVRTSRSYVGETDPQCFTMGPLKGSLVGFYFTCLYRADYQPSGDYAEAVDDADGK